MGSAGGKAGEFIGKNRVLSTLTDFADPFGIDPVGRWLHTQVANQFEHPDPAPEYVGPATPDVPQDARLSAIDSTKEEEGKMRRASTILTSGSGLLEEPSTYSASRSLSGS